jgi:hypothetical protein
MNPTLEGHNDMDKSKKCAHPSCNCQAREGSDYCGTYCEGAGKTQDVNCGCGHPACADKV